MTDRGKQYETDHVDVPPGDWLARLEFPAGQTSSECMAAIIEAAGIELPKPYPTLTEDQYREQIRQNCFHPDAQSVITVDGERVGYVCPACDAVLSPDWNPRAIAAQALMAAGFDPLAAITVTRVYSHTERECPVRLEVTSMGDPEPQYAHGMCESEED